MHNNRWVALPIAFAAILAAACADYPTKPRSAAMRPTQGLANSVSWSGAHLYVTTNSDTVTVCAAWTGCRDMYGWEYDDVDALVIYLEAHSNMDCRFTAQRLREMMQSNKLKVGNTTPGYSAYLYTIPASSTEYIVMSPGNMTAVMENRSRFVHEGYHARGNVSYNTNPTLREQANTSTYDPAADAHANSCT